MKLQYCLTIFTLQCLRMVFAISGLKCFACKNQGTYEDWCMEEPFNVDAHKEKSIHCTGGEVCGVTKYEEYSPDTGDWEPVVQRSCLTDCAHAEEKFRSSFARRLRHFRCQACDKDYCNAAPNTRRKSALVLLLSTWLSLMCYWL